MTLSNFLKLHQNGICNCITIIEESIYSFNPYMHMRNKYICEEEREEDIIQSDWYKAIKNRQVKSFGMIGGGSDPVELIIHIVEE